MKKIPVEIYFVVLLVILLAAMLMIGVKNTLDSRFYYTVIEARDYIQGLSTEQGDRYYTTELIDLGFLTTYTILLVLLVSRLYPRNFQLQLFAMVPGFFDMVETTTILFLLTGWRRAIPPYWLGTVTCLKWCTALIVVLLIVVAFFAKTFANRKKV